MGLWENAKHSVRKKTLLRQLMTLFHLSKKKKENGNISPIGQPVKGISLG